MVLQEDRVLHEDSRFQVNTANRTRTIVFQWLEPFHGCKCFDSAGCSLATARRLVKILVMH